MITTHRIQNETKTLAEHGRGSGNSLRPPRSGAWRKQGSELKKMPFEVPFPPTKFFTATEWAENASSQ